MIVLQAKPLLVMDSILISFSGIKVGLYCSVGKTDQGKFALDIAVKTLDIYTK